MMPTSACSNVNAWQVTFRSSASSPGLWKGELWIFLDIIFRMFLWFFLGRKPDNSVKDVERGDGEEGGEDGEDGEEDSDCAD